jgi:hypothetical protein
VAVFTASDEAVTRAIDRSLAYVASRQCRAGGFCFYRTEYLEEPNLHDTYYALAAYRVANRDIQDRARTRSYLRALAPFGPQSANLYYVTSVQRWLGEPGPDRDVTRLITALRVRTLDIFDGGSVSAWLSDTLRVLRLKHAFSLPVDVATPRAVIRAVFRDEHADYRGNLVDVYRALAILARIGASGEADDLKRFVERMQTRSLGFRDTDVSSSVNVDVLYAGVFGCALTGIAVANSGDVLTQVLYSQRETGGFARAPGTAGNLQSNYKALRILRHLTTAQVTCVR